MLECWYPPLPENDRDKLSSPLTPWYPKSLNTLDPSRLRSSIQVRQSWYYDKRGCAPRSRVKVPLVPRIGPGLTPRPTPTQHPPSLGLQRLLHTPTRPPTVHPLVLLLKSGCRPREEPPTPLPGLWFSHTSTPEW